MSGAHTVIAGRDRSSSSGERRRHDGPGTTISPARPRLARDDVDVQFWVEQHGLELAEEASRARPGGADGPGSVDQHQLAGAVRRQVVEERCRGQRIEPWILVFSGVVDDEYDVGVVVGEV